MIESDLPTSVPAILELEQALHDFRQQVEPLLLPEQEEEWNGACLLAREKVIWLLGLRLVGHCIAILVFNLFATNKVRQQAILRARGQKNLRYMNQGFFETPITLIGGVELLPTPSTNWHATTRRNQVRNVNGEKVRGKVSIRLKFYWGLQIKLAPYCAVRLAK